MLSHRPSNDALLAHVHVTYTCVFSLGIIRDSFDNRCFFRGFFFLREINKLRESAFCLRIPRRSSIRFYTSLKKPSYAIARTIRITPAGVVVGKIHRFADTASSSRRFDTRHEHEFVQTAKTSASLRGGGEGRKGRKRKRLDDNKRKRADGGRWRRAKVTLL